MLVVFKERKKKINVSESDNTKPISCMFPFLMKSSFSSVVSVDDRLHCAVN